MARNEHLVVVMLEPRGPEEEFETWPPHITIVPWFPCNNENQLDKLLSEVAGRHRTFEAAAGEVQEWGEKERFEVLKIEDDGPLQQLHADVFDTLERNGFPIHQKDYLGDKYTPHVTLRNLESHDYHPAPGTRIIIDRFSLIRQSRLKKSGRMIKAAVRDYELG